jgi:hypothetical protein
LTTWSVVAAAKFWATFRPWFQQVGGVAAARNAQYQLFAAASPRKRLFVDPQALAAVERVV